MSPKERWVMAGIGAVAAVYFFHWNSLYLFGVAALIYLFTRASKR